MQQAQRLVAKIQLNIERARARSSAVDVTIQTFKSFSAADGSSYTAALTYYFFFSIFPLLLATAAILGYLTLGNESLRQTLLDAGLRSVPLLQSILSKETLETIEAQRQSMAATAVVLALYTGTGSVVALEHALNKIHGVSEEGSFLTKRLAALKWLVFLGGATIVSLALGALSGYATEVFDGTVAVTLGWALGHVAGGAVGVLIFATAYKVLPARVAGWRDVLPGAICAAIAFEVLKEVGTWYLERGAQGRAETFGTLAAAAGFLVASFLIAQVTLLSATLNDVLAQRRLTRQSMGEGEDRDG